MTMICVHPARCAGWDFSVRCCWFSTVRELAKSADVDWHTAIVVMKKLAVCFGSSFHSFAISLFICQEKHIQLEWKEIHYEKNNEK